LNDLTNSASLNGALLYPGNTTVIWTLDDSAGNTSTCETNFVVNEYVATNISSNDQIKIYPNPTSGVVYINYNTSTPELIEVSDILGKVLYKTTSFNQGDEKIDITTYANGIYIVNVYMSNEKYTWKIIKQ
jgi:hypothetical protein